MKHEIEVLNKIRKQLAHCMASYGDEPDKLMHKLETLVIEWFERGAALNRSIRLQCPNCKNTWKPGHMDWEAFKCEQCKMMVTRDLWEQVI